MYPWSPQAAGPTSPAVLSAVHRWCLSTQASSHARGSEEPGDADAGHEEGKLSCAWLGVDMVAFDADGASVVGEQGEFVIRQPMPSMPVFFWGDEDGQRLDDSYFDLFPGVWRHGDWITISERGSSEISGRSDATLNRGGVRLGTTDLYSVTEDIPGVLDSLVVYLAGDADVPDRLLLFVVLGDGIHLDDDLSGIIKRALREQLSPRHVPDEIIAVPSVPRTLSGKKLEVPVKRLLLGEPPEKVVNRGALAEPSAIDHFIEMAMSS